MDAGERIRDLHGRAAKANGHAAPESAIIWPSPIGENAKIGLAGDFLGIVAPHSEADPAALLVQFLVAFGSACGREPHFIREADRHGVNLFAAIVGDTSRSRKGTSWGQVRRIIGTADTTWNTRVLSGASSGEGLIWQVRDPIERTGDNGARETVDPGVADKRLLVFEGEMAGLLRNAGRQGNTLSALIRNAWDSGELRTLTKNSPATATGAHVSIVGHITREELAAQFDLTEAANGFGNRFLWVCARRSKLLPEGGQPVHKAMEQLVDETKKALDLARASSVMERNREARELWARKYPDLTQGQPGLLGRMIARSEAQVLRLAAIYALLDRGTTITADHLKAALEVWRYCEDSARALFADRMGDPTADGILALLRQSQSGLSRTEISNHFGRNKSAAEIDQALDRLARSALAGADKVSGPRGRAAELWRALA